MCSQQRRTHLVIAQLWSTSAEKVPGAGATGPAEALVGGGSAACAIMSTNAVVSWAEGTLRRQFAGNSAVSREPPLACHGHP